MTATGTKKTTKSKKESVWTDDERKKILGWFAKNLANDIGFLGIQSGLLCIVFVVVLLTLTATEFSVWNIVMAGFLFILEIAIWKHYVDSIAKRFGVMFGVPYEYQSLFSKLAEILKKGKE